MLTSHSAHCSSFWC